MDSSNGPGPGSEELSGACPCSNSLNHFRTCRDLTRPRQLSGQRKAASIKSRLRKGHYLNRTAGAGERLLEHWKAIYVLDLRRVFPGPFPPSRELEELWRAKLEANGP